MLIRISEDALTDLNDGFWFYEHQELGLGDYFRASIQADITSLKVFAGMHRVDFRDYHRLICKTFPFAIYYTCDDEVVVVWAVIDCRRDPAWIRERLGA